MINKVIGSQPYQPTDYLKGRTQEKDAAGTSAQNTKSDSISIRYSQDPSVTYSKVTKNKLDTWEIDALKAEAEKTTENLRQLVERLILKQNQSIKNSVGSSEGTQEDSALTLEDLGITSSDIEAAQRAISADGEFGVKAVSDRLVNFAIAVSGGDKSKLSELISAIDEGFAAAQKIMGGELPELSKQTYDETMRKLKEWANDTNA